MKELFKNILKRAGTYYYIQGRYRYALSEITRLKNKIKYSKFKGKGFTCNICGASYEKFVPHYPAPQNREAIENNNVIAGFGDNIYCPSCGSSARQRLVVAAINEFMEITNSKILHFSPEKYVFDFIRKRATVTTADIEPGFYKIIDPHVIFADATNLPFEDEEFDMIIANHVLEHIPDDLKAMSEFYRVLKQDGKAILQVPYSLSVAATLEQPDINNPDMQEKLFGQKDHVRIYQLEDYLKRLRKIGFRAEIIQPEQLTFHAEYALQKGEGFISIIK